MSEGAGGGRLESRVEAELIRACQKGDARLYEPLVRAYEPDALRMALGILGDGDAARDAVQDTFVKAYRSLGSFDADRPFRPWLFQILRNRCRDMLRRSKTRSDFERLDARLEGRAHGRTPDDPARAHERQARRELLWKALGRLTTDHREVIVMKELEGLSYAEIGEILEIPEGTIASRLFHARRSLKAALEELGYGAE